MHFGLYSFDLFETIYSEAWDFEAAYGPNTLLRPDHLRPLLETYPDKTTFLRDVPRLIVEHNIHGIDIDPRAVQIAGLSLWLRAQRSWHGQGLKPADRPVIQRSNIVCAEPMPGDKAALQEFVATLEPKLLGELVTTIFEKMELAGEAGSLLKIEEEIRGCSRCGAEAVSGLCAAAEERCWLSTGACARTRHDAARPDGAAGAGAVLGDGGGVGRQGTEGVCRGSLPVGTAIRGGYLRRMQRRGLRSLMCAESGTTWC